MVHFTTIILSLSLIVLLNSGFVKNAQTQVFLPGFEEMPVMPGLQVIEGAGINFDTAAGRIAEAYLTGKIGLEEILSFYSTTLEQLGWEEVNTRTFEREGEALFLELENIDDEIIVHFRLSPIVKNAVTATPTKSK